MSSPQTILGTSYSLTLSGESESLLAQSMTRNVVILSNPAASDSAWVNPTGGTAAANAAGCIEVAAGDTIILSNGAFALGNAMTVFGTSGQPFTCIAG